MANVLWARSRDSAAGWWQDDAQSVAVTALNQSVGSVDDASGNSNVLLQSTSNERPLVKSASHSGGAYLEWLFDGSNDYLELDDDTALDNDGTMPFTISMIIRPTSVTGNIGVVGKFDSNASIGYYCLIQNSKISWVIQRAGSYALVTGSTTLVAGTSYVLTLTYDGSGAAAGLGVYIDGVAETLATVNDDFSGTMSNTSTFGVASISGFFFTGGIAEVYVYDTALDATEVGTLATTQMAVTSASPSPPSSGGGYRTLVGQPNLLVPIGA